MKKKSKLAQKLVLSSEKVRVLTKPLADAQLAAVAGAQPNTHHCEGCDCSSAWC